MYKDYPYLTQKEIYNTMIGTPYSYLTNQSTTAVNPTYIPPASVKQGEFKGCPIQKIRLEPGDVLLVHVSDSLTAKDCQEIMRDLNVAFPDNETLICNSHVLKGLTVLKPSRHRKLDNHIDIMDDVDIDEALTILMKGHDNDFLH